MSIKRKKLKKGDEVTLVSGEHLHQLSSWKDNKALITNDESTFDCYVFIKSGNGYTNSYNKKDLRLTSKNKIMNINKNFIKKQKKKKDFLTIRLIQNFILITRNDNKQ